MEANVPGAADDAADRGADGRLGLRVDAVQGPRLPQLPPDAQVAAVHHGNRGVIVVDDNVPAPFRISLDTIAASIQGPHWGDGDAMEEEEEE